MWLCNCHCHLPSTIYHSFTARRWWAKTNGTERNEVCSNYSLYSAARHYRNRSYPSSKQDNIFHISFPNFLSALHFADIPRSLHTSHFKPAVQTLSGLSLEKGKSPKKPMISPSLTFRIFFYYIRLITPFTSSRPIYSYAMGEHSSKSVSLFLGISRAKEEVSSKMDGWMDVCYIWLLWESLPPPPLSSSIPSY